MSQQLAQPEQDGQHEHDHDHVDVRDLPRVNGFVVAIAVIALLVALAGLFYIGWAPRHEQALELKQDAKTAAEDKAIVQVAQPVREDKPFDLTLPADALPWQQTSIFPRADGYLKKINVDIGDHVKEGQILAEIDAPDLDAQLNQAIANLAQAETGVSKAQADLGLMQATLARYEAVINTGGVTKQEVDEKRAAVVETHSVLKSAEANVKSNQATVDRLKVLTQFEKITAPFNGVVTARNFDLGALMSSTQTKEIFRIADESVLRISVNVPQANVSMIHDKDEAKLTFRNLPGKEFTGTISRNAGALDPQLRTLQIEIDVKNPDEILRSGMYAQAHLLVKPVNTPLLLPSSTIVSDAAGNRVWTVSHDKLHVVPVQLGRDFGQQVEVVTGLGGLEQVVTNPSEAYSEGAPAQVINPQPAKEAAAQ